MLQDKIVYDYDYILSLIQSENSAVVIVEYWITYYIVHIRRLRTLILTYIEILESEKKYEIKETY